MWKMILDYIHSNPTDIMAISAFFTAVFAGVMLFQLFQTSNWHRINNVYKYFPSHDYNLLYEKLHTQHKIFKISITEPLSTREVEIVKREPELECAINLYLNFFEAMSILLDSKVIDEKITKAIYVDCSKSAKDRV